MLDHIQRYREDGNIFGDKLHIIYLNASMQDETPLGKLMHDMLCNDPDDMYYEVLKKESVISKNKKEEKGQCVKH